MSIRPLHERSDELPASSHTSGSTERRSDAATLAAGSTAAPAIGDAAIEAIVGPSVRAVGGAAATAVEIGECTDRAGIAAQRPTNAGLRGVRNWPPALLRAAKPRRSLP